MRESQRTSSGSVQHPLAAVALSDGPARGETYEAMMSRQPNWVRRTVESLVEIASLQQNWDSYGARPPDRELLRSALALLLDASGGKDLPAPVVVPVNTGGVQFEWHTRGIDLELEVRPEGRYYVFFEDALHGIEREGEFHLNLAPLMAALDELARH